MGDSTEGLYSVLSGTSEAGLHLFGCETSILLNVETNVKHISTKNGRKPDKLLAYYYLWLPLTNDVNEPHDGKEELENYKKIYIYFSHQVTSVLLFALQRRNKEPCFATCAS